MMHSALRGVVSAATPWDITDFGADGLILSPLAGTTDTFVELDSTKRRIRT